MHAAELVVTGQFKPRQRMIEREHVLSAAELVRDLLQTPRTPIETADLLDERVVTCTVLAEEHRLLSSGKAIGWQRYRDNGIEVQLGLTPRA